MDQIYERMDRVTICETRHKGPLIKRTNEGYSNYITYLFQQTYKN